MPTTLTGLAALKARILVVLKAAPTWLTGVAIVIGSVIQQVSTLLPPGFQDNLAQVGGWIAGAIIAAIAIVRRVTPVVEGDVGLLPPDRPVQARDVGLGLVEVLVIICLAGLVLVAIKVY